MYEFTEWPPEQDKARIERYRQAELLYDSEHLEAFRERIAQGLSQVKGGDALTYLVLDYPKTIINIPANLLVGSTPVISYEDERLNTALKAIMERSRFDSVLVELAQSTGMRGDGLLEARRGTRGVVVEPKPAYSYFPELHPDNCRELVSECLAWRRCHGEDTILRVDRYESSQIVREAYKMADGGSIGDQITGRVLEELLGGPAVLATGLVSEHQLNTLVHLPNYRSDNDFFGVGDLSIGLQSLFEEANERASQICRILDRHADPKMAGPKLSNSPDMIAKMIELGYFEIGPNTPAPTYLTWDAQLLSAFSAFKLVIDEIFRHSEVSQMLAGFVPGARYDSGRAFRMQLAPTLAKVSRKRLYMDPAIKEVLRIAVAIELNVPFEDVPAPNVRWRDGLPKDLAEASQTENNRIASGTSSRMSAIRRLDDCDEATARSELEHIQAERQEFGGPGLPKEIDTSFEESEEDEDV